MNETGGLADGPDHAEVADRGPLGLGSALEEDDAVAALGRGKGVGQSDDAGTDYGDIRFEVGHIAILHRLQDDPQMDADRRR